MSSVGAGVGPDPVGAFEGAGVGAEEGAGVGSVGEGVGAEDGGAGVGEGVGQVTELAVKQVLLPESQEQQAVHQGYLRCKMRSYLRSNFSANVTDFRQLVRAISRLISAVSKPIFATKYSFCSIFRDLRDLHTFAPLRIQFFSKKKSSEFWSK